MTSGKEISDTLRRWLHEGNVRTFTVRKDDGTVVIGLPVTIALIIAIVAPFVVAAGLIAALVVGWRIAVEREDDRDR